MSEDIKNGIQLCPDGKYRWAYEVNMYRNPTIFYVIANMFLICYLVCVVLFSVISFCIDEEVLSSILILTGVFLFLFLITIPAYLAIAAIMGGTYAALFVMDEKGIEHHQMPKKVKKLQLINTIGGWIGAAKRDLSMVGLSLFSSGVQVTKTDFKNVHSIKTAPRRNLIKLTEAWYSWNHIYVDDQDYDWVCQYIKDHCPMAS